MQRLSIVTGRPRGSRLAVANPGQPARVWPESAKTRTAHDCDIATRFRVELAVETLKLSYGLQRALWEVVVLFKKEK